MNSGPRAPTPDGHSLLELGFSTFFLNRTNRSGIITGGPIGGIQQTGDWGLDARFNRDERVARIRRVAAYCDRITLTRLDAARLLRTVGPRRPERSLLYLDPPYYIAGTQRLYANYHQPKDHATIAHLVAELPRPWIVSYDDAPEIRDLYAAYRHQAYDLRYTAANRYDGAEVMFFSHGLELPEVEDPAKVDSATVRASRRIA